MNNMIKAEFVFPEHLREFEQRLHSLIEEALNKEIADGITLNEEFYQTVGKVSNIKFKDPIGKNIPFRRVAEYIKQHIETDATKTSYLASLPNIEGTFELVLHNENCSAYDSFHLAFMTNKYEYDPITGTICFTEKLKFWEIK